jgi:hypothetical protein
VYYCGTEGEAALGSDKFHEFLLCFGESRRPI